MRSIVVARSDKGHSDKAGILFFSTGVLILMGIITGEVFYPEGYSTRVNDISDLGGTVPPNSLIYQPSAAIFNITMLVSGTMLLVGTWFFHKSFQRKIPSLALTAFGIGILGVGVFPGNVAVYHGLFSLLTFVSGAFSAILSYKITKPVLGIAGIIIGVMSLIFLFGAELFIPHLGSGGTERWVAYPILLWLVGLGGYLMEQSHKT